jgi:hypothetical protein
LEFETRLCGELLDAAEEHGGWTIAGALYVAVDLDTDSQNVRYIEVIDQAAEFLHSQGVSAADMPAFVLDHWNTSHAGWLRPDTDRGRGPSSTRDADPEPDLAPLKSDEERVIRVVHRPDGNKNEIRAAHRRTGDDEMTGAGEPIKFVTFIRATDSDPNRAPRAYYCGPTLRSVYILVAEGAVNAPPPRGFTTWNAPELDWYIAQVS